MTQQPRILIVEDMPLDAELAIRELKTAQINSEVKRVDNKEAFIKALEEFEPHIILSDYSLPQFNALEALQLLKKLNNDTPFILYTGSLTEEVAVECMKEGAWDYILKSSLKRLPSAVLNILEKRESQIAKKNAISALQASEEQFRSIVETTNERIWAGDAKGRMTYNNPAVERILGYHPEEMLGKNALHFIHEEDREIIHETITGFIAERRGWTNLVSRWRHKDGSYRYLESNAVPILDAKGELTGYRGADRDITERKLFEQELKANEARLAEAQQISRTCNFEWTVAENKLIWSAEFYRMFGINPDEFGATLEDYTRYIHPGDLELFEQKIEEVVSKNRFTPYEHRIIREDGVVRDIYVTAIVTVGKSGHPIKVTGIIQDITERKQTEKELHKLAAIVESSTDAIISVDLDGKIISWNKGAEKIFSYNSDEAIGHHISILYLPGYSGEESIALAEAEEGRSIEQFETIRARKDGLQIPVSLTVSPIKNAKGEITAVSGIYHDITERKRATTALRESEYKLRTLFESMSEGLLQVDNEDRIRFVNNCFCEMTGYSEDELIGMDWSQLLLEEDQGLIKQINERRRKGISDRYEIRLKRKTGEILWTIVGGAPLMNAEGAITGSIGTFTDITERKRAEDQLLHDAFHDGLTGLANRTLFMDHLRLTIERARRKLDATFAVLFLDFDRFKIINDSLGHAEGDKLLKQIAGRLQSFLRPGDVVARLGGDEFTILLSELDDESDALRIAERIQEDLKMPFNLSGREIFTSASIGIALSTSGHNQAEDMLRDADTAMYCAKAKGKAQYQVFDQTMHRHALEQLKLETEMRYALERGEFCVHYQPIIKLETNDLVGFEALVRWNHPTRGMVSPVEFIPAAEENGLIIPLGKWIMQESCRQLRKWQNHNSLASNIAISVNLSSKQFSQFDLAEQIATILEETGVSPNCLKLEITESYILENTETAVEMMNRLRNFGIEISLDDFGTGYSSLSYLHRLPIDYLKIDRSFISRMVEKKENAAIVNTIIQLAQNLKMKVVAEGVETAEQLAYLKKLGCEYGQGYFFSKPLKASAAALVNSVRVDSAAPAIKPSW